MYYLWYLCPIVLFYYNFDSVDVFILIYVFYICRVLLSLTLSFTCHVCVVFALLAEFWKLHLHTWFSSLIWSTNGTITLVQTSRLAGSLHYYELQTVMFYFLLQYIISPSQHKFCKRKKRVANVPLADLFKLVRLPSTFSAWADKIAPLVLEIARVGLQHRGEPPCLLIYYILAHYIR